MRFSNNRAGFTIVELIVVVVVVAILAGIVIVGYGAWRKSISIDAVKSDLAQASAAMHDAAGRTNSYPSAIPPTFSASSGVQLSYAFGSARSYCLEGYHANFPSDIFHVTQESKGSASKEGPCTNPNVGKVEGRMYGYGILTVVVGARDSLPYAVGYNFDGQLAQGNTTSLYTYVPMQGLPVGVTIADVDVGYRSVCMVGSNGKLYTVSNATRYIAEVSVTPAGTLFKRAVSGYGATNCAGISDSGRIFVGGAMTSDVAPAGDTFIDMKYGYGSGGFAALTSKGDVYVPSASVSFWGTGLTGTSTGSGIILNLPGGTKAVDIYPGRSGGCTALLIVGEDGKLYTAGRAPATGCPATASVSQFNAQMPAGVRIAKIVSTNESNTLSTMVALGSNGKIYSLSATGVATEIPGQDGRTFIDIRQNPVGNTSGMMALTSTGNLLGYAPAGTGVSSGHLLANGASTNGNVTSLTASMLPTGNVKVPHGN